MESRNFFSLCLSLTEVQLEFARMSIYHHPALGGGSVVWPEILKDYHEIIHRPTECLHLLPDFEKENFLSFPKVIDEVIEMGLKLKVKSNFIILSGNVHEHGESLYKLGFEIHGNNYILRIDSCKLNPVIDERY
jgi:hypothetical protein